MVDTVKDLLVSLYPNFLTQLEDTNQDKFVSNLAEIVRDIDIQRAKLGFSNDIERPLQLWREQDNDYYFKMKYEIHLPDIKQVKLYRDGNAYVEETPLLLFDSGIIDKGLNIYTGEYNDYSANNILTANQSDWETSTTGGFAWGGTEGGYDLSGSLVLDNGSPFHGKRSLKIKATGEGADYLMIGANYIPLYIQKHWFKIAVKTITTGEGYTITPWILFYDSGYNYIDGEYGDVYPIPDDGLNWSWFDVGGDDGIMPPDGSVYAQIGVTLNYTGALDDEAVLIDCLMLSNTKTDLWLPGGVNSQIPTKKYYLEVTDYHDHVFYKGFPENDEIEDNKYDKDLMLDVIGEFRGIPRRTHITDIDPEDYANTYPSYCIDGYEWDYIYKERIKELTIDYQNYGLPVVELKRLFGILPGYEGRWRYVHYMGDWRNLLPLGIADCTAIYDGGDILNVWNGIGGADVSDIIIDNYNCLEIYCDGSQATQGCYHPPCTTVIPEEPYTGSLYFKGLVGNTYTLNLDFTDGCEIYNNIDSNTNEITATGKWERVTITATPPATYNKSNVYITAEIDRPQTFHVRQVQLEGNSVVTDYVKPDPSIGIILPWDSDADAPENPEDAPLVKWIQNDEWNSAVTDFNMNLNLVPLNIDYPSVQQVQDIIDNSMPLTKKGYFNLSSHYWVEDGDLADVKTTGQMSGIYDRFILGNVTLPPDNTGIIDYLNVTFPTNPVASVLDGGIIDLVSLGPLNFEYEHSGIYDKILWNETAIGLLHDTDTDFALDVLAGVYVTGTGSSAKVVLNVNGDVIRTPTSAVNVAYGNNAWSNPNNAVVNDNNPTSCYISQYSNQYSDWLLALCSGIVLPLNVTIDNVIIRVKRKATTKSLSNYFEDYYLGLYGVSPYYIPIMQDNPTGHKYPTSYETYEFVYPVKPNNVPWSRTDFLNNFNIGIVSKRTGASNTAYIDYMEIEIYYHPNNTGYIKTITVQPLNITSWLDVVATETKPPNTTIKYDVLKASDESVILSNQTAPVDLSSISPVTYPAIKIKATLETTNADYVPMLDTVKVRYILNHNIK